MTSSLLMFALSGLCYLLPGLALLTAVRVRGLHWIAKVMLSVPLSLVMVPFLFGASSDFGRIQISFGLYAAITGALWLTSILLITTGHRPTIAFRPQNGGGGAVSSTEWLITVFVIAGVAVLLSLPRADALVHGSAALSLGPYDTHWQLAELVSVARTGLPSDHYFFPDARLAYYCWSLIYPALLGSQQLVRSSLAQSLAVHSVVQAISYLGILYWFLRMNLRSWMARILGFAFLTVAGGYDFFVQAIPGGAENWQKGVAWLVSRTIIPSLLDRLMAYPQHIAGLMAFLLVLIAWRNLRAHVALRLVLLGLLMAFSLGTSAEIFLAECLGLLIIAILYASRWLLHPRRLGDLGLRERIGIAKSKTSVLLGVAGWLAVFVLGSAQPFQLTTANSVRLTWSSFRVPLLERFLNSSSYKLAVLDRVLTVLGLPVAAVWVLMIEVGFPLLVFLGWVALGAWKRSSVWRRFLIAFPIIGFILLFLVRDTSQANNLSINGSLPLQVCLVAGAATAIDGLPWRKMSSLGRGLVVYLGTLIVISQAISPMIELIENFKVPLGAALQVQGALTVARIIVAQPPASWPASLAYIRWANASTPENALFIEEAPNQPDTPVFRRLERMRLLELRADEPMTYYYIDAEVLASSDFKLMEDRIRSSDLREEALKLDYVKRVRPPLYYVSRTGSKDGWGKPVYSDRWVIVYALSYPN